MAGRSQSIGAEAVAAGQPLLRGARHGDVANLIGRQALVEQVEDSPSMFGLGNFPTASHRTMEISGRLGFRSASAVSRHRPMVSM
jgi:hypothetical protein